MSKIPDDIVSDVLLLLPVKALLRFRCLSKPLCSLIDSPDFIDHHLSHSLKTRSNLFLILRDWNLYTLDFDSLSSVSPAAADVLIHPLQKGGGTEAVGSCNGLLALRNSERDLALYNPATRKYKRVPVSEIEPPDRNSKTGYVFYGFGFDSVSEDYRLVRMATFVGEDDRCESFDYEYQVQVYSLKNDSWKRIKGLPYYLRFLYKPFFQVLHRRGYGVFACNALHWVMPHWPELGVNNSIIAFDIVNETFQQVPQPNWSDNQLNFQVDAGVLEGRLCAMCNCGHECIDLWVMEEYGVKESWIKLFSFRLSKSMSNLMFLRPLCYSKDRENMLLEVNDHKLVWYDWNKTSVRTVKVKGGPRSFGAAMCVGSLVPLDDGGENEQKLKKEKRKTNTKMRDDFLSVGFKLKL
ncbi:F-box protein CPR1 [Ricinus communis]|uniref:F-box protein CPR1 n=1 Tax=Ricinus communis TaxID=3988 RepID=UPI00201ADE0B|nr:F-box protein CPR1 [Ricinus communis]